MKNYQDTLMYKEINETPLILSTLIDINLPTLLKVKEEFEKREIRFSYVTGRGTSENALLFYRYLIGVKMGLPVDIASPSVITVYNSVMKYDNSLVIAVSQSGEAMDGIEIIKQAKAQGALTVAITNFTDSPLAKLADYHLYLNCKEEKSLAATKTYSAQMYLLSALVDILANDKESLDKLYHLPSELLSFKDEAESLSDKLSDSIKDVKDGFVVTRGISLGLADEARIKMSETCYMRLQSYSSVAFYHGPLAMVDNGTFALIIAPKYGPKGSLDDFRNESFKECVDKLNSLGADVHVLTNNLGLISNKAKFYSFSSSLTEEYLIFLLAFVIQLSTVKVACKKGLDPDKPRSLKKVTLTK
ncbi:MAG: SIS domain-containing protein [Bacillales bacterium]|nr:SIS domain-containing protein [Bacillales bacterium]